jgi:hypothetical protein
MNYQMPPPADGQADPSFFAAAQHAGSGTFANAHRRAFSSFSNEGGNPFPQGIPAGLFSTDDYSLGYDDGNDPSDPKRRRIARVGLLINLDADTQGADHG